MSVDPDSKSADERKRRFDEIYNKHARPVYWTAFVNTRNHSDAEEVTQDVFLVLWRKWHSVDTENQGLGAWLLVTCDNLCRNRMRRLYRRDEPLPESDRIPAGDGHDPEAQGELGEALRALRAEMLTWPELDRQIFRLCTNDGLTYKEAAARLGVTPGVIRNQLSRSGKALRVSLSSVGWLPDPQETKR